MHSEESDTQYLYVRHLNYHIKEEKSDAMCNVSTAKT
jgi:hypothetical protein